jgi:xanthine dehydrogenase accessory factor
MSALDWIDAACGLLRLEPAIVRVTVAETRGSSPRECGATILVTARDMWGTIGGGNLEWQAIEQARRWLREGRIPAAMLVEQRLGPDLAQCCGGVVTLWMERLPQAGLSALEKLLESGRMGGPTAIRTVLRAGRVERVACDAPGVDCQLRRGIEGMELLERCRDAAMPLWLFGTGHVGQAVVRMLEDLPLFDVNCVDSRPALLPRPRGAHIRARCVAEPVEAVPQAMPGTAWLVMTHDHELDYQICTAVLARGDARWLGLIGSASKAARFRSRLAREGFTPEQIRRLCSPVGITSVPGKLPAAIAVSIVAQLLTLTAQQPAMAAAAPCDPDCRRCAAPLAAVPRVDHSPVSQDS